MIPRLGVNIDHVATLRQQRDESYPEITRAAEMALMAGASQLTIHLREDRRHIQDKDVNPTHKICLKYGKLLNLEMGCTQEMIAIASQERPEWVCLVPEKRAERTTEGGLDTLNLENFELIKSTCLKIKDASPQTKISLFVEANEQVLMRCLELKADAVEIHTGEFARDFLAHKDVSGHLKKFQQSKRILKQAGWGYHAGHGITFDSLKLLLKEGLFEEYNIGHWIVAESLFVGLDKVVRDMVELMRQYPVKG